MSKPPKSTPQSRRALAEKALEGHPRGKRILETFTFREPTEAEREAGKKLKERAKAAVKRYGTKAA